MKAILYVLALVAIGAAAFFSNSNKSKFLDQQTTRLAKIETNKRVSAQGDKTKTELGEESKTLENSNRARAEVEQSIDNLRSKERELAREMGSLDSKLEEQVAEIKQSEDAIAEAKVALEAIGIQGEVTAESIESNITDLQDMQKELTQEIGELEANIEANQKKVAQNRDELGRLAKRKAERDNRMRRNAMESVITAVDQDWGFVVIGAGSNTGFTPQTRLLVKREGRAVAELKPSSIEASQTIAEIDFDTVAPGVRLQPGDRVILTSAATN